jgi:hypothetical protein
MEEALSLDGLFNETMGAAAGYGTLFHLDRTFTSQLLGFEGPTENVTDPITQRWEAEVELAYAVTVTLNHLSSIAQTLILLSTREFNMIRLDDRHCTGSSIMPQKRNPDCLEAVKAKPLWPRACCLLSTGELFHRIQPGANGRSTGSWIWWTKQTRPCPSCGDVQFLQVNRPDVEKIQQAFVRRRR